MISENTENRDLVDERGWVNSFGDNGWSFTKGSSPLVCFSITPRGSQLLRGLLQKGPVKVRANVDSRYYAGVYPYVTGVIRGTDGAARRGSAVAGPSVRAGRARQRHRRGVHHRRGRDGEPADQGGQAAAAETHHPRAGDGRMLRHALLPAAEPRPREAHRRGDVHRFAGGTAKSRRAPSTPGFSIRIRPSRTWTRWRCGWRRSITRWSGGPWHSMEHRSSTDNYLGDPSHRNSDRDAAWRLRRARASQQPRHAGRRSTPNRCAT